MSRKKKAEAPAAEVEVIEEAELEVLAEVIDEEEKPAAEAEESEPVVYIGPDIRFVARRGTVYSAGLPEALETKIGEIPAIRGLIVPVSNLSTAMQAVAKSGTSLNNLYKAVKAKLK